MFSAKHDTTVSGGRIAPVRLMSQQRNRRRGVGSLYRQISNLIRREWIETKTIAARIGVRTGEVTRRVRTMSELGHVETRKTGRCTEVRKIQGR